MLFNLIHAFSLIFVSFLFFIPFWTFFPWFSCSFLLTNAFSLDFLLLVAFSFFSWKFLAVFMLCDCYFLLQCNFILNFFWLKFSGGCPNHSFWCLIPQGTHKPGGQAHLARMHLLTKSSIWHCSFQISLQLLVKKDTSSFRHYLSFLHNFYNCIITIPPLFFELHCCSVMTSYWASWMIYNNSLQFILFASYHCLVHRKFHL